MEDDKTIAEEMKFFWRFNSNANSVLWGLPLREGTQIGLNILWIVEVVWLVILPLFPGEVDFSLLYVILWTLVRFSVLTYCFVAAGRIDFQMCLNGTYAIQTLTICHILNTCITLIAMVAEGRLFGTPVPRLHNPYVFVALVSLAVLVCLNLYVTYIMFSFTKHLGLGNEDILNGVRPIAISSLNVQAPNDFTNTSLLIGLNPTDINSFNTSGQFVSLDKIVLNDPRDVQFAQSAQQAIVNGMALPSGISIPIPPDNRTWRIVGSEILLV
jgi:hypothetical protein